MWYKNTREPYLDGNTGFNFLGLWISITIASFSLQVSFWQYTWCRVTARASNWKMKLRTRMDTATTPTTWRVGCRLCCRTSTPRSGWRKYMATFVSVTRTTVIIATRTMNWWRILGPGHSLPTEPPRCFCSLFLLDSSSGAMLPSSSSRGRPGWERHGERERDRQRDREMQGERDNRDREIHKERKSLRQTVYDVRTPRYKYQSIECVTSDQHSYFIGDRILVRFLRVIYTTLTLCAWDSGGQSRPVPFLGFLTYYVKRAQKVLWLTVGIVCPPTSVKLRNCW